jgi:hypothetical protein
MRTQLTKGMRRRIMYVENKHGLIDGIHGRIGWVSFSRTGQTILSGTHAAKGQRR